MAQKPNHSHAVINLSPVLLLITLSFAAGIAWAANFHISNTFLWLIISLLGSAAFTGYFLLNKWKSSFPVYILVPLFFFIAALYVQPHLHGPDAPYHINNLITEQQIVRLDGILHKMPTVKNSSYGYRTNFLMNVKFMHFSPESSSFNAQTIKAAGLIQLNLKGLLPEDLIPGDRFITKAIVSKINTYSTPGTFNYRRYLTNQSIWVNGWVESPVNIIELHETSSVGSFPDLDRFLYLPERLRASISTFLDNNLSQPSRGLYKAILIGDKRGVPKSIIDNFTRAGCIHILAISGMHMGIISLVVIGILTWIFKRSTWLILKIPVVKTAAGIAILPLFFYALIAGFNTPVVRALIMTIMFVMALLFDRPGSLPTHILFAALLILIWQPTSILSASFQLSFSAVLAIGLLYPRVYQYLFPHNDEPTPSESQISGENEIFFNTKHFLNQGFEVSRKWLLAGFALSVAAMVGTLPIVIFHFNRFSLVSPVSNLIVEPLVCLWSLIWGIIACLFIPTAPWIAINFLQIGSWGLIAAEKICTFFASLPFSSVWMTTPTLIEIFFYYIFIIVLTSYFYRSKHQQRFWLKISAVLFLCFLVSAGYPRLTRYLNTHTTVSFLDVGHGSAVLLQLPHNKNILIDGGGASSENFNIGERIIAPFLWKNKIPRLDGLVITHPHADHYNGLPFIVKQFQPKELWVNGDKGSDESYQDLLALAERYDITTRVPDSGMVFYESGNVSLQNISIHNSAESQQTNKNRIFSGSGELVNPNNKSLVLRLDTKELSYLFPGDINQLMERKLIAAGLHLKADILLSPHHGSSSSNSSQFLAHVDPSYIIISAGRHGSFQIKSNSLNKKTKNADTLIYTTSEDGTISVSNKNGNIQVDSYQVN